MDHVRRQVDVLVAKRAQLAAAKPLDELLGPDRSTVVGTLPDGWTIRRVTRLSDQRREGGLMRNCLMTKRGRPDHNCFSLRDDENLPHLTFSLWRIKPGSEVDRLRPWRGTAYRPNFVDHPSMVFYVPPGRVLKDVHRQRLLRFAREADRDPPAGLPRLPARMSQQVLATMIRAVMPTQGDLGSHGPLRELLELCGPPIEYGLAG